MTHPFHPLVGEEFSLVTQRHNWGEDRVYYHDAEGRLKSLPARWSSVFPEDPFVVIAAGRSCFRVEDLRELSELIGRLRR
ncbi:MAG: Y4bD/Y4pK family protein [Acidobacteriota bacterium]|nr:MAG: Y4bD/Y4pK family protein [Acidobacteriota bacterium]